MPSKRKGHTKKDRASAAAAPHFMNVREMARFYAGQIEVHHWLYFTTLCVVNKPRRGPSYSFKEGFRYYPDGPQNLPKSIMEDDCFAEPWLTLNEYYDEGKKEYVAIPWTLPPTSPAPFPCWPVYLATAIRSPLVEGLSAHLAVVKGGRVKLTLGEWFSPRPLPPPSEAAYSVSVWPALYTEGNRGKVVVELSLSINGITSRPTCGYGERLVRTRYGPLPDPHEHETFVHVSLLIEAGNVGLGLWIHDPLSEARREEAEERAQATAERCRRLGIEDVEDLLELDVDDLELDREDFFLDADKVPDFF